MDRYKCMYLFPKAEYEELMQRNKGGGETSHVNNIEVSRGGSVVIRAEDGSLSSFPTDDLWLDQRGGEEGLRRFRPLFFPKAMGKEKEDRLSSLPSTAASAVVSRLDDGGKKKMNPMLKEKSSAPLRLKRARKLEALNAAQRVQYHPSVKSRDGRRELDQNVSNVIASNLGPEAPTPLPDQDVEMEDLSDLNMVQAVKRAREVRKKEELSRTKRSKKGKESPPPLSPPRLWDDVEMREEMPLSPPPPPPPPPSSPSPPPPPLPSPPSPARREKEKKNRAEAKKRKAVLSTDEAAAAAEEAKVPAIRAREAAAAAEEEEGLTPLSDVRPKSRVQRRSKEKKKLSGVSPAPAVVDDVGDERAVAVAADRSVVPFRQEAEEEEEQQRQREPVVTFPDDGGGEEERQRQRRKSNLYDLVSRRLHQLRGYRPRPLKDVSASRRQPQALPAPSSPFLPIGFEAEDVVERVPDREIPQDVALMGFRRAEEAAAAAAAATEEERRGRRKKRGRQEVEESDEVPRRKREPIALPEPISRLALSYTAQPALTWQPEIEHAELKRRREADPWDRPRGLSALKKSRVYDKFIETGVKRKRVDEERDAPRKGLRPWREDEEEMEAA